MCLFDRAVMSSGDLHDCHTFQSSELKNLTALAVSDLHWLSMLSSAVSRCDSRLQPAGLQGHCRLAALWLQALTLAAGKVH